MMKVVGEEGTSLEDFVTYLKCELLDAIYLQQDAFDPVDAATPLERQQYVFAKIAYILRSEYNFDDKDDARAFFLDLTQEFRNWNPSEWKSDTFAKVEQTIDAKLKAKVKSDA
jgi:V/A-type H+-transporting ATPase subunit A